MDCIMRKHGADYGRVGLGGSPHGGQGPGPDSTDQDLECQIYVAAPSRGGHTAVAVDPSGSDVSTDSGESWTLFDRTHFLGVNCSASGGCWAVGSGGMAAQLVDRHP